MNNLNEVYICEALRTPIGRYGGSLATVRADDLAVLPITAIMEKYPNIDWQELDEVIIGCANQAGEDNRNVARMATLLSGLPESVPAYTVNRLCASGLEAVVQAYRAITCGDMSLVLAGGSENMSRAPYVVSKSNNGFDRNMKMFDTTMGWRFVNSKMAKQYGVDSMPETANNVAIDFKIDRESQDLFALRSQQRVSNSRARLAKEIINVNILTKKGIQVFSQDEHSRDTSLEGLAKLKSFLSDNSTITAGNSSGINDGSAMLLIADAGAIKKQSLTPMAKIVGAFSIGISPRIMGFAPALAIEKLLKKTGVAIADVEHIELNEAFASQALAVLRHLNIADDAEYVNPYGGAIALGHPLGMSGARLIGSCAHELKLTNKRYALASMCVGVGQGSAILLERV